MNLNDLFLSSGRLSLKAGFFLNGNGPKVHFWWVKRRLVLQMETPCSPSGVVNERLQAALSSRPAKTDTGRQKNGWRDYDPRAGECAVCNNNIDTEQQARVVFNINVGRLLKEDYGPGQLLFRVCGRRCQQCFNGDKKDQRKQAALLLRLRRCGLKTDARIGEQVTTVADKSPMRRVPEGVGVVTGVRFITDPAFLCAEITVKLAIEGTTHKVWPEGLSRLKSSPLSAAHSEKRSPRTPLGDRTNTRSDEQFTAYTAQKRRAVTSERMAVEHMHARDDALQTAAAALRRAEHEGSNCLCCFLEAYILHFLLLSPYHDDQSLSSSRLT
jgi:hypothetical protein